jgi:hypothetical protein
MSKLLWAYSFNFWNNIWFCIQIQALLISESPAYATFL